MTETGTTEAPPARRPVRTWDVVVSIILLILGIAGWLIGIVLSLIATTFVAGDCIDASCDPSNSDVLQLTGLIAPAVIVVGILVVVLRLVLRRIAWPFALAAGILCAIVQIAGVLAFGSAPLS